MGCYGQVNVVRMHWHNYQKEWKRQGGKTVRLRDIGGFVVVEVLPRPLHGNQGPGTGYHRPYVRSISTDDAPISSSTNIWLI